MAVQEIALMKYEEAYQEAPSYLGLSTSGVVPPGSMDSWTCHRPTWVCQGPAPIRAQAIQPMWCLALSGETAATNERPGISETHSLKTEED